MHVLIPFLARSAVIIMVSFSLVAVATVFILINDKFHHTAPLRTSWYQKRKERTVCFESIQSIKTASIHSIYPCNGCFPRFSFPLFFFFVTISKILNLQI